MFKPSRIRLTIINLITSLTTIQIMAGIRRCHFPLAGAADIMAAAGTVVVIVVGMVAAGMVAVVIAADATEISVSGDEQMRFCSRPVSRPCAVLA
jgi:hypothetical protein